MKDQSHKDEMSAAIRGDFQRLRDRGVAATLAPRDEDPEALSPAEADPELPETVISLEQPEPEVAPAGEAPPGDEPRDAGQPGFFARLLGR